MWMFGFMVERQKGESDESADQRARAMHPQAVFVVAGPKVIHDYIKADIDAATASVLSSNNQLLAGTARLTWVADQEDVRRVVLANQACDKKCDCPLCKGGAPPSLDFLFELHKDAKRGGSRPDPLREFVRRFGS